jgi:ABC-type glycerol-3-phosphate transport system substrate-binding protein
VDRVGDSRAYGTCAPPRCAINGKPSGNTPQVVTGVRFFKQLYDAGVFPKGVDDATYRRMFWQEKVAMLTDNNAVYFIAKSQNPCPGHL